MQQKAIKITLLLGMIVTTSLRCTEALFKNISNGKMNKVQNSINEGVDLNSRNKSGNTPLHIASLHRRTKIAQLLIDNGADVHATNNDQETPLHHATLFHGDANTAQLLLYNGAHPNTTEQLGKTPLHRACSDRNAALVQLLIQHGANLCAQDNNQLTPHCFVPGMTWTSEYLKRIIDLYKNNLSEVFNESTLFDNTLNCDKTLHYAKAAIGQGLTNVSQQIIDHYANTPYYLNNIAAHAALLYKNNIHPRTAQKCIQRTGITKIDPHYLETEAQVGHEAFKQLQAAFKQLQAAHMLDNLSLGEANSPFSDITITTELQS